jgi:hypothetical protein
MTATTAERIQQAKVHYDYRQVTYVWQNPVLDKDWDGTPAGEQVELCFAHDPKRKQYTATIRLVWWQPNDRGFTVTMYAPFDGVTYPSSRFHNEPVARYGEKSFENFQFETLALIADLDLATSETVLSRLLKKVLSF